MREASSEGSILVVDEDVETAAALLETLEQEGHPVEQVGDGRAAYTCLQDPHVDFGLLVLRLPPARSTAASFLPQIYRLVEDRTPVLLLCTADEVPAALDEVRRGAFGLLLQPWRPEMLVAAVERALTQRRLYEELRDLRGREVALRQKNKLLAQQNADLFEQARLDALTGLPNRRRLDEDMHALDANVQRHTDRFAIALVDVDRFGRFNKTYGLRVGDRVLQLVATTLRDACRQSDLVYRAKEQTSDPAYRLGGDEFVLVLAAQSTEHAVAAMERIRDHLATVQDRDGDELPAEPVTISVGVAAHDPEARLSMEELLLEANEQLKAAKQDGGDRICP